ncbi:dihydroorotate dehydrogenase [Fusobacterium sp. PH5-44]|uniref:dihydroorotate dehydrogenase n=1 Tax=unclassified Fusobacterium TaxID=2648384 RepID=UPI003D1B4AA3
MSKLNCKIFDINFKNPVVTSSGCFGFGLEYKDYFDPNILGAVGLKGTTLNPKDGNYGIRIAETPGGMLNCVGLENPGIEYVRNVTLKELKENNITAPLIININGSTIDDYVEITKIVDKIPELELIELNISCPNVKDGGMAFGANPDVAGEVTKKVRAVTNKPLIVKLSPNVTDIVKIAKIVEDNGADAISLINTLLGMSIDIKHRKPLLGNTFGGLSGPAVKPVALRMVYQVYKNVKIPIVGMGGINSWEDALEFILAGARMVSIGTGIFSNPMLPVEVITGLEKYCIENNINNITDLIGAAH